MSCSSSSFRSCSASVLEPLRILGRWKRQATLEHYVQEAVAREAAFVLHPGERENLGVLARGALQWAEEWVEKRERETRWRRWVSGGRMPPPEVQARWGAQFFLTRRSFGAHLSHAEQLREGGQLADGSSVGHGFCEQRPVR